ncbi:MAG TPA: hypothetical protein VJI70_03570 [Candidatus Paceibacterota bacterium]
MNTSFDPTLENDIKELMKEVPAPIRAFFASGKVETVAKNLMQKYKFHIDQGAIVEREIILLLLGLKSPDEFTKTLAEEAKLDTQTVNGITRDVNDQIFVPLREEMRKGPQAVPQIPKPIAPPREVVLQSRTTMIPANPQMPSHQAQTFASMLKYSPPQKYFNLQNKIPPQPSSPATSIQPPESRLLEDHEEPRIEFHKTAPPPLRPAVAFGEGGPSNLPGAMPPPPQPVKPYSSDPYREPIDEK